jgi:DNA-binding LacI/PurR family transcriptional regulator
MANHLREEAQEEEGRAPATLRQVAIKAGVSPSTVSRFLRGQLQMRPATEERIREAMSAVGYRRPTTTPAPAPGASRRQTPAVVALVLPEMDNAYYGVIGDHVVEEAERRGLTVMLCSTRNQRLREESYVDLLSGGAVSGLLYLGAHRNNRRLTALIREGFAVVVLDEQIAGVPPVDSVIMDDYAGGYQATSHLIQLGHQRIAFVGGPSELRSVQERHRGYIDALRKAGVDPDPKLRLSGPFGEQFGMSAMAHLLSTSPLPTAVFAASDLIALGFLAASETHGVQVPDDLSVVGFDDLRFSGFVRPRLSTIHSPVERLAAIGVEMLVERLNRPDLTPRTEVLPVSLVERASTAPPRAGHAALAVDGFDDSSGPVLRNTYRRARPL